MCARAELVCIQMTGPMDGQWGERRSRGARALEMTQCGRERESEGERDERVDIARK